MNNISFTLGLIRSLLTFFLIQQNISNTRGLHLTRGNYPRGKYVHGEVFKELGGCFTHHMG